MLKIYEFRENRQSVDQTFLPGVNKITFTLAPRYLMIVCRKRTSWYIFILHHSFIHSFIHSTGLCRMRRFIAVPRKFFHSSLLYYLSFHPFLPTSLPSSLTKSCHLFLGLPLSLWGSVVVKALRY